MENKRIWLITGISSGLGKALAEEVMNQGDFVIGTFRRQDQMDSFNTTNLQSGLAVKLDITNRNEARDVVDLVNKRFGRLDFLVNNAGFGFAGAVEEATMEEVREVFEANFFGTLRMTQLFLPIFRKQRSGHIFQISSHGGVKAFPGFGIYNASKFALEGFSEAMAQEIEPLGIKTTIVEPGPFRTKFAADGFRMATTEIEDYSETAGKFRSMIKSVDGKQEGDPRKAAEAIIEIANSDDPPLRLVLGKVALGTISSKLNSVRQDLEQCREIAKGSVFEN